jgi:hypothetical protein
MFRNLFGNGPKKRPKKTPEVPTADIDASIAAATMPNEVEFYLCSSAMIPKRVMSQKELHIVMNNAETVWQHCVQLKPMLLPLVEMSVDDLFLQNRMAEMLKLIYTDEQRERDYDGCVRGYLKLCVMLFCVYTSTEVAYRLLSYDRHGTFNGILGTTFMVLNMENVPIQHDLQMGYITNAVWAIGHSTAPTRTTHAALRTLGLFEMEKDEDMREVIDRVNRNNAQVQIRYVS